MQVTIAHESESCQTTKENIIIAKKFFDLKIQFSDYGNIKTHTCAPTRENPQDAPVIAS